MLKLFLFFSSLCVFLSAQELLIVADKNFKEEKLTVQEIKDIFLSKRRFSEGSKILVMNHTLEHPLRRCFEKNVLKKSRRSLERYWQKAYYKGQRPPKIVKSVEMLVSYLEKVQPSIGYAYKNDVIGKEFKVLYRGVCK